MKKQTKTSSAKLPKGAYRLPTGGHVTESHKWAGNRRITIRAVHKDPPDLDKLARALILLANDLGETERENHL